MGSRRWAVVGAVVGGRSLPSWAGPSSSWAHRGRRGRGGRGGRRGGRAPCWPQTRSTSWWSSCCCALPSSFERPRARITLDDDREHDERRTVHLSTVDPTRCPRRRPAGACTPATSAARPPRRTATCSRGTAGAAAGHGRRCCPRWPGRPRCRPRPPARAAAPAAPARACAGRDPPPRREPRQTVAPGWSGWPAERAVAGRVVSVSGSRVSLGATPSWTGRPRRCDVLTHRGPGKHCSSPQPAREGNNKPHVRKRHRVAPTARQVAPHTRADARGMRVRP